MLAFVIQRLVEAHQKLFFLVTSAIFLTFTPLIHADFIVTKLMDTVVDPCALTIEGGFGRAINGLSFQQDAVVTHAGHQYVAYYDGHRRVCIARRKLPSGTWRTIRFSDYDFRSNDAHNVISLGVCPSDGTIHLAFDHHGHPLHYRRSQPSAATDPQSVEWAASLFGPITNQLESGKPIRITYPRFIRTPDGDLQFCYRRGGSGNGDRMLVEYDGKTGRWTGTRQIDSGDGLFTDAMGQSLSRCSYPNGYTYGPCGNLHTTWVWRESSQGANHDLIYVFSRDRGRTWLNNAGDPLSEPPHVNSPGVTVVPITRGYGLMNTHGQAVDSQGRIHVVMWHCTDETLEAAGSKPGQMRWGPPKARRYLHYWRDSDGVWHHRQLPGRVGTRPKVFMDADNSAFVIYATPETSAQLADGHLHRRGDLVIAAASAQSKWTDWEVVHTERGPFLNEMLGDPFRWKAESTLSIMVQKSPRQAHQSTPLRILDFGIQSAARRRSEQ